GLQTTKPPPVRADGGFAKLSRSSPLWRAGLDQDTDDDERQGSPALRVVCGVHDAGACSASGRPLATPPRPRSWRPEHEARSRHWSGVGLLLQPAFSVGGPAFGEPVIDTRQ